MSHTSETNTTPGRRATDRLEDSHTALVPMERVSKVENDAVAAVPLRSARHDPSFLTHLIAIAERCPQTRLLRRATPEDAMAAYRATDANGHVAPAGITTRQNI